MGNERKRQGRLAILATLGLCAIYPFVAPLDIGKETVVLPARVERFTDDTLLRRINSAGSASRASDSFAVPGGIGFVDENGRLVSIHRIEADISAGTDRWAALEADWSGHKVFNAAGELIGESSEAGYPVFMQGRSFLIRPDLRGVAEIDERGALLWRREFPSVLTAVAARKDRAAFGLLDGSIIVTDTGGEVEMRIRTPEANYACVYGLALDKNGRSLAVISGKDPQRLVLYTLGESAAVDRELILPFFSPLPADLAFFDENRIVAIASGQHLLTWNPDRGNSSGKLTAGLTRLSDSDAGPESSGQNSRISIRMAGLPGAELFVALVGENAGNGARLCVAAPGGRLALAASLDGAGLDLCASGGSISITDSTSVHTFEVALR